MWRLYTYAEYRFIRLIVTISYQGICYAHGFKVYTQVMSCVLALSDRQAPQTGNITRLPASPEPPVLPAFAPSTIASALQVNNGGQGGDNLHRRCRQFNGGAPAWQVNHRPRVCHAVCLGPHYSYRELELPQGGYDLKCYRLPLVAKLLWLVCSGSRLMVRRLSMCLQQLIRAETSHELDDEEEGYSNISVIQGIQQ